MPQTYEYWDDSNDSRETGQTSGQQPVRHEGPTQSQPDQNPGITEQVQESAQTQPQPQQQAQQTQDQQQHQPHAQQPPSQPPRPHRSTAQAASASNPYADAQQLAYVAVPQKKSRGWIVGLVFVICLFAFTAFCVKTCSDVVAETGMYGSSAAGPSGDSVAVIDLDGVIQYDDSACSPEGLKKLLDRAEDNDDIKAVVLRVNSGGGTATAGEEMAEYVRQFSKPVVVSSASLNASAAYEISAQADYIYVAKSTEIGAIGTAMELTDISGLLDMLGISMDTITSSESKDSSYGYRPLTEEERAYYQRMIDQINEVFIDNVAEGRHMSVEDVRALATGLSFTGLDAVENGLADAVGTLEDAMDKAAELAGVTDYSPYDLGFSSYDLSSLYTLFGNSQKGSSQPRVPLFWEQRQGISSHLETVD